MEGIEIMVEGHPARITRLLPFLDILSKLDHFVAVVEFDKALVGTLSVGLDIPAKRYARDELISVVQKEAEEWLKLERDRQYKECQGKERERNLHALAVEVSQDLGILPSETG